MNQRDHERSLLVREVATHGERTTSPSRVTTGRSGLEVPQISAPADRVTGWMSSQKSSGPVWSRVAIAESSFALTLPARLCGRSTSPAPWCFRVLPTSRSRLSACFGLALPLDGELLAIASASHSGEPFHLDAVREILALAGLDESALQTPASYPLDPKVHADYIRAGGVRAPICMDCSGKHAAMLLTCVTNDWPTDTYLAAEHPLQVAITETFTELTQGPPSVIGIDGCGAPLLATPLVQLARAIGRIAAGAAGTPEATLASAMKVHPEFVSGTNRAELCLVRAFPAADRQVRRRERLRRGSARW